MQESVPIYKTSKDFWVCYRRLSQELQKRARKSFALLKKDPKHPSLNFKKVTKKIWSARISRDHRVLAHEEDGVLVWYWIGKHDEYMRQIREHRQQRDDIILEPTEDPIYTSIRHDQEDVENGIILACKLIH